MWCHLVHDGVVVGRVDLAPAVPVPAGLPHPPLDPDLLTGVLEPTPAYETIRATCQAWVPASPGADGLPMVFGDPGTGAARVGALGLRLQTPAGAPLAVRHLHVMDLTGIRSFVPPEHVADISRIEVSAVLATAARLWPPLGPAPAT